MSSYYALDSGAIGNRIRLLRQKLQITQYAFADMLFISPSYLALIESGKRLPTLEILAQAAKLGHVTVDFLLFGELPSETQELQSWLLALTDRYPADRVEKALALAEFYLELEEK